MEAYLLPGSGLTKNEKLFMFLAKTRNLDLKDNFKYKWDNLLCPIPKCAEIDDQKHLYLGKCLYNKEANNSSVYEELFSNNHEKSVNVMRILKLNFESRQLLLSSNEDPEDQDFPGSGD